MKKSMVWAFLLAWFFVPVVYAQVMDAGNATCPVSGDKVSGKDFVEHEGKNYGLCCAMCAGKLTKNPEKYLSESAAGMEAHDHSM